jgi:small GTP-binding protein
LQGWPWIGRKTAPATDSAAGIDSLRARESVDQLVETRLNLRLMLEDTSIPASVRAELSDEFRELQSISDKVSREEIHIAAFGRVGVGKSSLLNALLGKPSFSVSPLHGETTREERSKWTKPGSDSGADPVEQHSGQIVLIDTPGIDELDGAEREALAHRIARRADIVIMVCAGDLVETEFRALEQLAGEKRAVLLALNKADHYTPRELGLLLERLRERTAAFLGPGQVVPVAADPRPDSGKMSEGPGSPDVAALKSILWALIERQGKSLAALNASLFTSDLDRKVATRIVEARHTVANRVVRNYCITKGLLVAVNPIPVADLLAAAGTDVAMVMHLGEVYGFRLNRREAARLLLTISAQMAALMGAYWGSNLLSSLLKTASAGLSTTLTAAAQGALAWYATLVTGQMAETWFSRGKSWGSKGPQETAREIIASLDRDEVLMQARDELAAKLAAPKP